ncbi:choice-of-anchor G family protein [Nesterenkonia sp. F]|uniref:choice-of-anchor G family protein n=1 Tax=Nesterenkonia sp. F TaxID=795955 RepID=UPI0002FC3E18|nr:choice-of-anchor G family protein [Nesterenkonia sp. F]
MREPKTAREPGATPDKPQSGLLKRCIAFASTAILATGLTISGAGPAHAAPTDDSEGLGKFLGGQAAGIDLDDVAEISGAYAENPSGENPVVTNPLGAEVLNALDVDLGDSLQLLGDNGLIQLGAVNQYGEAQDGGDARAASGAVSDQGAISVGGSEQFPSDASITLTPLLSGLGADGLVSDLSLELGAVSSSIEQIEGGEPTSNYDVAGATLNFESPAVGGVYDELLTTVDGVQGTLDGLSGSISDALDASINLGIAGVETNVDFTPPDLTQTLPDSVVGESSGVTVDLTSGAVTVDLESLLAANPDLPNLNEMPANSELLSGPVVAAVSDGITQAITDAVTEVVQNLRDTVSATDLAVTTTIDATIAGSVTVTLDGTLGEVLEGSNPDLVTVDSTGAIRTILSALGLDSVDELGTLVLNTVGGLLGDSLTFLTDDLESTVDGITCNLSEDVVGPVLDIVNQVVTVLVNVQPETGDLGEGSSTVRAVQVSLLPSQPLATVDLASSTVRGTLVAPVSPEITVDPSEVPAGDATTVDGTGFTPDSTATLQLQDAEGNPVGDPIEDVATDADGMLTSTDLTVPEGTTPGDYTIVATDDTSSQTAEAALTVTGADSAIDPAVTVDPTEVPAGDSTTVEGTGYTPDNTATVQLEDADGNPVGESITVDTDGEGNFTEELPVPEGTEPGDYTVVVTDDETGESAQTPLTVTDGSGTETDGTETDGTETDGTETDGTETDGTETDGTETDSSDEDATDEPSVTVNPDTAAPGDDVTVGGENFDPDTTVTVEITDENGDIVDTIEGVEVEEDGSFTEEWTVPEGTDPGELTVTATDDQDPSVSESATLTVTESSGLGTDSDGTVDPGAGSDGGSDDGLAVTGPTGAIGLGLMALLFLVVGVGIVGYAKERRMS